MDGILLINKPENWTSQDVCLKIKHLLHVKKVGHTGTLDPFATGLMVVTIGEGTKLGQFIEGLNKTYIATLKLGYYSSTGDTEGEIIKKEDIPSINKEEIKEIFKTFIGKQYQLPPMTSAIKINGKKLYEYAREGIDIERKSREIEIYSLELLSYEDGVITFISEVSKGTYIRTLGEDIALKLNTSGYLTSLNRIKVGRYNLQNAINIEDVNEDKIIPLDDCLSFIARYVIDDKKINLVKNGNPITINKDDEYLAIYDKSNHLLAVYHKDNDTYKCVRGFNRESL